METSYGRRGNIEAIVNSLESLLAAIVDDDRVRVRNLLEADHDIATQLVEKARLYQSKVLHWLYAGDTALHLAAAGFRVEIVRSVLAAGADANAAGKHRHATPLHYAADGYVSGPAYDPRRQVETLKVLLDAGADINAQDKNGASPLHRAVRTRAAAAVSCLLKAGADPTSRNKPGSTPFHLAVQNTGHGGSGSDVAIAGQRQIIETFLSHGASTSLKDSKDKSVLDWARSDWIRDLLIGAAPK